MAASTSIPLSRTSHSAFIEYHKSMQELQADARSNLRSRMETIDKSYQREEDKTLEQKRARAANKAGNSDRFQNITVPVVMPQVESAVTYQTSVFLTGYPLFGVVSTPQFIDEAMQLESLIEDQSNRGGWARHLMISFRDGYKYNFAPMEMSWEQQITANVETDLKISPTEGVPKKIIWTGNRLERLDPYNMFYDPRVLATQVYKDAEFAGHTKLITRIGLKSFIESLPDKIIANITPALESGLGGAGSRDISAMGYFQPTINPEVGAQNSLTSDTNWLSWAGLSNARTAIKYKDTYELTTLYARVMPSEFDLRVPNRNIPQVYKLIIVNHEHIIYCERQTNAHNYIPILIGQPYEDGLDKQTKSLATNLDPFQAVTSSYMNSILASRRRAITDRVLYDPSRVTKANINSSNPSAKIPVKPAAYGKKVGDAVHVFPYNEDQAAGSMQQISQLLALSNSLSGQNQVQQGQFVKGNRTLQEFDSVMQNANGRDQMASILMEYQVFSPMKEIMKLNILQYQGGTTVYNRDKSVAVEIDPVKLRKAVLEFKISDGLTPKSKIIGSEQLSVALQVIGSSPEISKGYNIAPLFSYLMKTQGAKITEFEKSPEQMAYEQALGAWQSIAQTAVENGIDPKKLPPQPKPEEFNYNPQGETPADSSPQQEAPQHNPGAQ